MIGRCEHCGDHIPTSGMCTTCLCYPKPERKPHKCPVCGGSGVVWEYPASWVGSERVECHTCNGKGIVWEPQ